MRFSSRYTPGDFLADVLGLGPTKNQKRQAQLERARRAREDAHIRRYLGEEPIGASTKPIAKKVKKAHFVGQTVIQGTEDAGSNNNQAASRRAYEAWKTRRTGG